MMQHHKYSLTELEDMLPWEREIYINLLLENLQTQNSSQSNNNPFKIINQ